MTDTAHRSDSTPSRPVSSNIVAAWSACLLVPWLLLWAGPAWPIDYVLEGLLQERLEFAEQGDAEAQYLVGDMYLKGRGTYVNYPRALRWLAAAAAQGHRKAQFKLGYMYLKGRGVVANAARAYTNIRAAAEAGYAPAKFYLGQMYALGLGTRRNTVRALEWMTESIQNGYRPPRRELELIRAAMDRRARHNGHPVVPPAPPPDAPPGR